MGGDFMLVVRTWRRAPGEVLHRRAVQQEQEACPAAGTSPMISIPDILVVSLHHWTGNTPCAIEPGTIDHGAPRDPGLCPVVVQMRTTLVSA